MFTLPQLEAEVFPSSPYSLSVSSSHLMSLSSSPRPPLQLLSSPCPFLTLAMLLLPRPLSPWHAWWFDIANWCQTTKLYFPSAVLSPALSDSLFLSFYLPPPPSPPYPSLLLYSLICSGGLVARLQDFHITSFSPPEDLLLFTAVLLWPLSVLGPLSSSFSKAIYMFHNLFILISFPFFALPSPLISSLIFSSLLYTVAPVWHVFTLHLIIHSFNHCPINTAAKLSWCLWNCCHGFTDPKIGLSASLCSNFWSDRICNFIHLNWQSSKSLFFLVLFLATSLALSGHCCGIFPEMTRQSNIGGSSLPWTFLYRWCSFLYSALVAITSHANSCCSRRKMYHCMCQRIFFFLGKSQPPPGVKNNKCKSLSCEPSTNHYCVISISDGVAKQTFIWAFHGLILQAKARNFPVHHMSRECLLCILCGSLYLRRPCRGRASVLGSVSQTLSIHRRQGQAATGRRKMAPTKHPPHINSISLS